MDKLTLRMFARDGMTSKGRPARKATIDVSKLKAFLVECEAQGMDKATLYVNTKPNDTQFGPAFYLDWRPFKADPSWKPKEEAVAAVPTA